MYSFIPAIRTDRYREIKSYKDKNFTFIDEQRYRLIDNIFIVKDDSVQYQYEVRVDFPEVRFFIIKDGSSIYLTIYQLYELFKQVYDSKKISLIFHLRQLMKTKKKEQFIYKGVMYDIPKTRKFSLNYCVIIPDSNLEITFNDLFYLLVLIQEKSNYLCSISKTKKKYSNGIIRLLIALLESKIDNKKLQNIGWNKDQKNDLFKSNQLQKIKNDKANYKKHNAIVERKYYLTEEELSSILLSKNPSISSMTKI